MFQFPKNWTRVDTSAYGPQVWEAVACHKSQLPGYQALRALPDEYHHLWGMQTYYRAFSMVNGGRGVERDLFAGLREAVELPVRQYYLNLTESKKSWT